MSGIFGPHRPNWLLQASRAINRHVAPHHQSSGASSTPSCPPAVCMYFNAAYYPNWHVYRNQPPSSLKLDVISHLFYAFAWVKPDGTVYLSDEWADTQMPVDNTTGCLRSFAELKRKHSVLKLILSVGGGGKGSDNFAAVAQRPEAREQFAKTARDLCLTYGLDGIDVDWEHPSNPAEGAAYVELLARLRAYLPPPRFTLTTALPAGAWALRHIDLGAAARQLDLVNVMAYDFSGPWTATAAHHAQLRAAPSDQGQGPPQPSGLDAVAYLTAGGVPPAKILLGVPCYGRSFLAASRPGAAYSGHGGHDGVFEYRELPRPGAAEHVDGAAGAAFCVGGDDAGGLVSYDNVATVRMKADWVKEAGLAGLFYWTATGDKDDVERSLVYNGYLRLHS
ncbi:putative class V chitinase [Lineolata rhizophorae]|uniref:chitinase n=1 Tax=Lineolata rhizophorae TaxID=578093 RepID=A0A6A6P7C0_9PEZI|nr:putative class V chitinase [Lineolata rhizophorae]